jgi:hypothetical protein
MPVLYNSAGRPEPSPAIVRRLRAIDSGLGLQWVTGVAGNWAVTMRWPEQSEKWRLVQSGELPADRAWDIVGWLPMDCPLDDAPALMERMLRTYPREDVQRLANAALQWNEEQAGQEEVEAAVAEVLDLPNPAAPKKRGRPRKEK